MMPYQSYVLYQAERPKSRTELAYADERAALLAAGTTRPFRAIAQKLRRRSRVRGPEPRPAVAVVPAPRVTGESLTALDGCR
jgi:hypothetical protein